MRIRKVHTGNGERLEIESLRPPHSIRLDALVLEPLTWRTVLGLGQGLKTPFGPDPGADSESRGRPDRGAGPPGRGEHPADLRGDRRSRRQGARIVVLPETLTTGWVLDSAAIGALAEEQDGSGPALTAWRDAARAHDSAVIGGYPERLGERLYNSVTVIDRRGEIAGGYRKLHLFSRESEMYASATFGSPCASSTASRSACSSVTTSASPKPCACWHCAVPT